VVVEPSYNFIANTNHSLSTWNNNEELKNTSDKLAWDGLRERFYLLQTEDPERAHLAIFNPNHTNASNTKITNKLIKLNNDFKSKISMAFIKIDEKSLSKNELNQLINELKQLKETSEAFYCGFITLYEKKPEDKEGKQTKIAVQDLYNEILTGINTISKMILERYIQIPIKFSDGLSSISYIEFCMFDSWFSSKENDFLSQILYLQKSLKPMEISLPKKTFRLGIEWIANSKEEKISISLEELPQLLRFAAFWKHRFLEDQCKNIEIDTSNLSNFLASKSQIGMVDGAEWLALYICSKEFELPNLTFDSFVLIPRFRVF
jgi:hypothetical protein